MKSFPPKSLVMMKFVVLCATLTAVLTQVPIPESPLGFVIANGSGDAPIQLEMFVDLLCPYSKMAYPAVKQVVHHLLPTQIRLKVHQFPLPYHHQSFPIAQASETITHALGRDKFEAWMEAIYTSQDSFGNKATENIGQKEFTGNIHRLAKLTFPNLTDEQWFDGMSGHGGTDRDIDTRTAWKYACSRSISGTPTFLLNDVAIDADPAWTFHDWMEFLDPFLKEPPITMSYTKSTLSSLHIATFILLGVIICVVIAGRRFKHGYQQLC